MIRRRALAAALTAAGCGVAAALFLGALDVVTTTRQAHPAFVWSLPLLGIALGAAIDRFGAAGAGMAQVIDGLVDGARLPASFAPQVVLGTLVTHLGGGSAGREGTAVQLGAGIGDRAARLLALDDEESQRLLVACGVAAGFGAVFGTPWAAAVFACELPVLRRLHWHRFPLTLPAALLGDVVARACGAQHTPLPALASLALSPGVGARWCALGVVVAALTITFVVAVREGKRMCARLLPRAPQRLALGGVLVIVLWRLWGDDSVLGLGVPSIVASLGDVAAPPTYWLAKFATTVVTVSTGFIGGEVTPLFGIGSSAGNVLAPLLGLPVPLTAAVCMCALLACATRAPLAIVVMSLELFGLPVLPHLVVVVVVAWVLARRFGIYSAQRSSC